MLLKCYNMQTTVSLFKHSAIRNKKKINMRQRRFEPSVAVPALITAMRRLRQENHNESEDSDESCIKVFDKIEGGNLN